MNLLTGSTTPPRIRDIHVTEAAHDSVNFSYAIQSHLPDTEAGIYVDGALVGRVPGTDNRASATALLPGTHSLDIIPLQPGQRAPQRQGFTVGDRVYLQWEPTESAYLAAYKIYRDDVLIGTVTDRQVFSMDFQATAAGGRVSVFGYPSTEINTTLTVEVIGNTFTFDGQEYEWQTGSPVSLPYGVMIIFHDKPGMYDSFDITIGVQSYFLSTNQEPGTYTYSVIAEDTAGNVSTQLTKTIRVMDLPAPPTVDGAELTGTGDVRIYTDYNPVFGTHDAHINTDTHFETLTLPAATTLPAGSRFYAFPVTSDGVEVENLVIHQVPDPATQASSFDVPADLELRAAPAGDMNLAFTYRFGDDDTATLFRVMYGTDPEDLDLEETVAITANSGIRSYSVSLPGPFATGEVVYARVRAEDTAAVGEFSAIAGATAVADEPVLTGPLYGTTT